MWLLLSAVITGGVALGVYQRLEPDLTRVELEVFDTNHIAVALYRKHGFFLEGTRRGGAQIDGASFDVHMMALQF